MYPSGGTLTEIHAAYNLAMRWKEDHPSPPRSGLTSFLVPGLFHQTPFSPKKAQ